MGGGKDEKIRQNIRTEKGDVHTQRTFHPPTLLTSRVCDGQGGGCVLVAVEELGRCVRGTVQYTAFGQGGGNKGVWAMETGFGGWRDRKLWRKTGTSESGTGGGYVEGRRVVTSVTMPIKHNYLPGRLGMSSQTTSTITH